MFRDQTGLSVTPALWSSIREALDGSEHFVLLASPEAAGSKWVNREIEHWVATKSADKILPVLTDGIWAWDRRRGDFTEDSSAVPAALRGVFSEEPLFLDLRWARGDDQLSLQHARFRDAIAQLAAPMHGVSKDELEGEDVRQHRQARRLQLGGVASLLVLTLLASVTGVLAVRNAARANASAQEMRHQQKVAEEQHATAIRYATEAQQQQALAAEQQARASDAADEAERQQALADQAAADAAFQSREATRQQQIAARQQKLADQATQQREKQQQLAKQSAEEAAAATTRAQQATQTAKDQQRLATAEAAEAKKQQALADKQQRIAVSRRLLNQARTAVASDPATALRLGVAAQSIQSDPETRNALAGVVASTRYVNTIPDVVSVASAPDGTLAALDLDGKISLWNVTDGTRPRRLSTISEGTAGLSFAMSPDGRTVAFRDRQNVVQMWDVADRSHPSQLSTQGMGAVVDTMAFSPDSKALAVGLEVGQTLILDVTDRTSPGLITLLMNGADPIYQVGFSSDRKVVLVNQRDHRHFWDISNPGRPMEITDPALETGAVIALHPKSPVVASGQNSTVNFWGLSAPTATAEPATAEPAPAASAGDHESSASAGDPEPSIPVEGPAPQAAAATSGEFPLLGSQGGPGSAIATLAYSTDGLRMLAADDSGAGLIWDTTEPNSPRLLGTLKSLAPITSATFTADNHTLVTVDNTAAATLWNVDSNGSPKIVSTVISDPAIVAASVFGTNGRSMSTVLGDGRVQFWKLTDPAHPAETGRTVVNNGAKVRSVAFSPDQRTMATTGGLDGQILITDVTDPAEPAVIATFQAGIADSLSFSPDGRTLAANFGFSTLALWDFTDRHHPRQLSTTPTDANTGFGQASAFSPDARVLALASGAQKLNLYRVADRAAPARIATLTGHGGVVLALAFSPDGKTLASGSADHTIIIWDVSDPANPIRLSTLPWDSVGSGSLAFNPDGRTLAAASDYGNKNAVLWDIGDRAAPIHLAAFNNPGSRWQTPVSFSPDGHTLVSGGTIWDYGTLNELRADPAAAACAISGRGLSRSEWKSLIPELDYRPTC